MAIGIKFIKFKISIFIFFLLIFIKADLNNEFVNILKISDGNYFVVLKSGIYIYDNSFCKINNIDIGHNYIIAAKISEYIYDNEIYIISYVVYN